MQQVRQVKHKRKDKYKKNIHNNTLRNNICFALPAPSFLAFRLLSMPDNVKNPIFAGMEKISVEQMEDCWEKLTADLSTTFGRKPDLQGLLFLIGVQELGQLHRKFSKEEKQYLMHIAVCHVLCADGYFRLKHRDQDGWPHYEVVKPMPADANNLPAQEQLLKYAILKYFERL